MQLCHHLGQVCCGIKQGLLWNTTSLLQFTLHLEIYATFKKKLDVRNETSLGTSTVQGHNPDT